MKKNDKYIIIGIVVFIIIVTAIIYIPKWFSKANGSTAIITKDGFEIERIDLDLVDEPYEFTVESKGSGYNTIYVEKNKIKFIDANCPDKLCVKTGGLTYSNDIAVCLPHGVFIEIESDTEGEVDSLLY